MLYNTLLNRCFLFADWGSYLLHIVLSANRNRISILKKQDLCRPTGDSVYNEHNQVNLLIHNQVKYLYSWYNCSKYEWLIKIIKVFETWYDFFSSIGKSGSLSGLTLRDTNMSAFENKVAPTQHPTVKKRVQVGLESFVTHILYRFVDEIYPSLALFIDYNYCVDILI